MRVSRIIKFLSAIPDHCVRQLPETERHRLARECLRILVAAEVKPPCPKSGVLADLEDGRGQQ